MLKAAYGGGGRGMRKVWKREDVIPEFDLACSEATQAFGNGAMFVEKLIEGGRHIEIQIIGDHQDNIVHLFERDCSVQRRNQKVIEIAPAPWLDDNTRQGLFDSALKLAHHVGYQNAGTVEFLVDIKDNQHYFIEVNARLQVEHTVTEMVTGYDLVKTQIGVREGKTLPEMGVETPKDGPKGFATQCRITTENSKMGFVPDTGRVDLYRPAVGRGKILIFFLKKTTNNYH